jgi:hypothetical protein
MSKCHFKIKTLFLKKFFIDLLISEVKEKNGKKKKEEEEKSKGDRVRKDLECEGRISGREEES